MSPQFLLGQEHQAKEAAGRGDARQCDELPIDNGDVGDIGDPKLVGTVQDDGLSKVWKDWLVVIAVGRCRETTSHSGLKVMLTHKTADLLVIDNHSLMPEGDLKPFFTVEAPELPMVHDDAFAPEQDVKSAITKSLANGCEFTQSCSRRPVARAAAS